MFCIESCAVQQIKPRIDDLLLILYKKRAWRLLSLLSKSTATSDSSILKFGNDFVI